jgi:hypothetical protein
VIFRKKKPPPDPLVDPLAGVALPNPQSISAFANNHTTALSGFSTSITAGFRASLLASIERERAAPEPKDEPKTVIGLTGYRLYTLDNDLYLHGQQGKKQEGRESEQAKHNGDNFDYLAMQNRPHSHPAPAWDCLCGFAAFFWPTSLEQPSWNGVLAEVQAGGRTIVCETGWRAERIALSKLWIACPIFPDSALETLRERYEIPVEVLK